MTMNCTTGSKGTEDESYIEKTASLTSLDTKRLVRNGRRKAQPEEEAAILSRATTQATVAARSILASGGTKATALSTAKAAAESILIPADTGNVKVFLSRRKAKQQVSVIASMALMSATASLAKRPPSASTKIAMSFMQSSTSSKSTSRRQPPSVVQQPTRRDEPSSLGIGSAGSSFADDSNYRRRNKKHHHNSSNHPKSSSSKKDYWTKRQDDRECDTPTSGSGCSRTENLANENPNEDPIYAFFGPSHAERKAGKQSKHKPERPFTCHMPERQLSCDSSVSSNEKKPNKRRDKDLFSFSSEEYDHNSIEETVSLESHESDIDRKNNDAFAMLTNALSCHAPHLCHRGKKKVPVELDFREDTTLDKKSDHGETDERHEEETSGVESGGSFEERIEKRRYSKRRGIPSKSSSADKGGKRNQISAEEAEERRKLKAELKNKIKESMEQIVLRALAVGEMSPRPLSASNPSFTKSPSPQSVKVDRISLSRNESPSPFFPGGTDDTPEDQQSPVVEVVENIAPMGSNNNIHITFQGTGIVPDISHSGTASGDGNDDICRIGSSRSSNPLTRGSRFKNWVLRRKQVKSE